jgi:hypothetical protein
MTEFDGVTLTIEEVLLYTAEDTYVLLASCLAFETVSLAGVGAECHQKQSLS